MLKSLVEILFVMRPWTHHVCNQADTEKSSTVKASVEDSSIPPLSKKTNPFLQSNLFVWTCVVLRETDYFITPSCGSAWKSFVLGLIPNIDWKNFSTSLVSASVPLSLFLITPLLVKTKAAPGHRFNLWINYESSSSETTIVLRELGLRENESPILQFI